MLLSGRKITTTLKIIRKFFKAHEVGKLSVNEEAKSNRKKLLTKQNITSI